MRATGNGVGPPADAQPQLDFAPNKFGKIASNNVGNKKTLIVDTAKPSATPGASPTPSELPAPFKKIVHERYTCTAVNKYFEK